MNNAGKVAVGANVPMLVMNQLYRWFPDYFADQTFDAQTLMALSITNLLAGVVITANSTGEWAQETLNDAEHEITNRGARLCLKLLSRLR